VALARGLLRKPRLLILDESTSALDRLTELRLLAALAHFNPVMTVLMITHRPSVLTQADRILVMERGRIVEDGAHDVLITRDGPYWRMWEADERDRWHRNQATIQIIERIYHVRRPTTALAFFLRLSEIPRQAIGQA